MTQLFRPNQTATKTPQQRWQMVLRLIISTFLVVSLFLIKYQEGSPEVGNHSFQPGLMALGLYYFLALGFYFLPSHDGWTMSFSRVAQMVADLGLAICLTMVTGGSTSPFSFLFLIAIIHGAFLGGIRPALVVATFSAAIWGGQFSLQTSGLLNEWLPWLMLEQKENVSSLLTSSQSSLVGILINTGSCYLVAVLSGYLAGQFFLSHSELIKSKAHFDQLANYSENIVQSIDAGLITTDYNGTILSVNRAGLEILGQDSEEVIGHSWLQYLPQFKAIPATYSQCSQLNKVGGGRFNFLREGDGQELILEMTTLSISLAGEKKKGLFFIIKDQTALSQMEAEVRQAEHLVALGGLAAGLAHELRTPLSSMTGAWHMLSHQAPDPKDQARLMDIIGREMERLAKLTSDFLAFARPTRGNPTTFDLPVLLDDQLKVFTHSRPEGVSVDISLNAVPQVYFDPDQCTQIFWNLMNNAVEAGKSTSELLITVRTDFNPDQPEYVVLSFTDTGPGIPAAELDQLFQPFVTTKSAGNGLGLAIVSRIVHQGGGSINVTSQPGGPTTFTVFLPKAN